ncbi:hypothetical protein [Solitalea lacus]|uniref:hypothetical protein n=1 Tax=Solitalea lacus TaxID=2911172 RepID=UPI001EDAAD3B|nr:hypothetical protein [Solitalea lacus]UKJ08874.1 hypothetical protein L2B55_06810 [Solitalea lacus]
MPDVKEIIEKARSFNAKARFSVLRLNIVLSITIAVVLGILIYFKPEYLTTKIGVLLAVIAMVMVITGQNKMIKMLFKFNSSEESSQQYLQNLILYRNRLANFQRQTMSIYFALLSLGIGLYMIEYTVRMQWAYALLVYSITFAWIAVNWFYFRPRQIKKQQEKVNEMIIQLERVSSQLIEGA